MQVHEDRQPNGVGRREHGFQFFDMVRILQIDIGGGKLQLETTEADTRTAFDLFYGIVLQRVLAAKTDKATGIWLHLPQ